LISRDIENTEYALGFDKPSGTWVVLGPAEEYRRSENRQAVINALEEAGEPVGPAYIAEALDMNPNTAKVLMRRMFADGDIRQEGRGLYVPCNP
jgi:DNA-binding IclR family transcriptional regulator